MNKTVVTKTNFKFLAAYLKVKRVLLNPLIPSAHERALTEVGLARYNVTRFDINTFTF